MVGLDGGASGIVGDDDRPVKPVNVPRTFDTIRWRTVKETSEWAGSMAQVPAVRPGGGGAGGRWTLDRTSGW